MWQDVVFPCQQHRDVLLSYPFLSGEFKLRLNGRALLFFFPGWFVTLVDIDYSRMFLAFRSFGEDVTGFRCGIS